MCLYVGQISEALDSKRSRLLQLQLVVSRGQIHKILKSFIFACVVKKCFRWLLSTAAIIFGYILYHFAWKYFVIFLSKCSFLHVGLKDQSEVHFIG